MVSLDAKSKRRGPRLAVREIRGGRCHGLHALADVQHDGPGEPRIPSRYPCRRQQERLRKRDHRQRDNRQTQQEQQEVGRHAHTHRGGSRRAHEAEAGKRHPPGAVAQQQMHEEWSSKQQQPGKGGRMHKRHHRAALARRLRRYPRSTASSGASVMARM